MGDAGAVPWELGSDFEWPSNDVLRGNQSVPWAEPSEDLLYLESGRQALVLLSDSLRSRGYARLLMPNHYCESMLDPFVSDGWSVEFFEVDAAWRCQPPTSWPDDFSRTLVFSMSFFGVDEGQAWRDFLCHVSEHGGLVLSDETHRLLAPGLASADFRIGSLRKILPVPDGAFLAGLDAAALSPTGSQGALRVTAMRAKGEYLQGRAVHQHLPMFAAAEEITEHDASPARMSAESERLLRELDFGSLATARVDNHARLAAQLPDSVHLTTTGTPGPSHAVISCDDPRGLRSHLIERSIYCPVHWPAPERDTPSGSSWRRDVLSIPIDHRYGVSDMDRVARAIAEFTTEGR